jgi:hypothetical protein
MRVDLSGMLNGITRPEGRTPLTPDEIARIATFSVMPNEQKRLSSAARERDNVHGLSNLP